MKKQYKLYYRTIIGEPRPLTFDKEMFCWRGHVNDFRSQRIDVCTCDNIYTAQVLRDIIHDSLKQDVLIEEVEVD